MQIIKYPDLLMGGSTMMMPLIVKGMQLSGSVRSAWRLSAPVTDAIHLQTVPSVSLLAAAHIRFNSARP